MPHHKCLCKKSWWQLVLATALVAPCAGSALAYTPPTVGSPEDGDRIPRQGFVAGGGYDEDSPPTGAYLDIPGFGEVEADSATIVGGIWFYEWDVLPGMGDIGDVTLYIEYDTSSVVQVGDLTISDNPSPSLTPSQGGEARACAEHAVPAAPRSEAALRRLDAALSAGAGRRGGAARGRPSR